MPEVKPKILVVVESLDVNDSSGTKGRVALINNLAKAGFDLDVLHYTQKEVQLRELIVFQYWSERELQCFF